jgi:hypothetical protein
MIERISYKSLMVLAISGFSLLGEARAQLKNLARKTAEKIQGDSEKQNQANPDPATPGKEKTREIEILPAEIIFTSQSYGSFEEAKKHTVSLVKDGDPLWMYIRLPQPFEQYVDANPNNKDKDGKVKKFIMMGIGSKDEPNGDYMACNVTATDAEAAGKELQISLSPCVVRKGPSLTCFLDLAAGFEPKLRELEIRLYTKIDGDRKAIGRGRFTLDLTQGKTNYTAIREDFRKRISKGAPENNTLPKPGSFSDPSFKGQALRQINAKGIQPIKIYYSVDDWQVHLVNETSRRDHRSLYGAYTYKRDNQCLYGVFEVIQNWSEVRGQWMDTRIELRDDFPIMCDQLR